MNLDHPDEKKNAEKKGIQPSEVFLHSIRQEQVSSPNTQRITPDTLQFMETIPHTTGSRQLITEKYVSMEQMQQFLSSKELQNLIQLYFSNPTQTISIKANDILMRRGQRNDRLYFVRKGKLRCETDDFQGTPLELFVAYPNSFLGLYSFFSKTFRAYATIYALEDSELSYVDQQSLESNDKNGEIYKQFMPYVVNALRQRGLHLQEILMEKERAMQQLIDNEKYTCLGEMAAGITHELNNVVAVLERNTQWLCDNLPKILPTAHNVDYFKIGLEHGHAVSNKDIRTRSRELEKIGYTPEHAEILAQMGLEKKQFPSHSHDIEMMGNYWETGATCYDMLLAARQAAHVVKSVRALAQRSKQQTLHPLNESIQEALVLLHSSLRQISLQLNLECSANIFVNKGELVQVWSNIIKNAYESLIQAKILSPTIIITTTSDENYTITHIEDNGPGIPRELLPKLFQPHITTKSNGQFIGLGLGLTISHRIITSYSGTIKVESMPGKTTFIIKIPIGDKHESECHLP